MRFGRATTRFAVGSSYARRSGFTLIELLVVVGIIGLLAALLLPAVQSAREAARRAQCSNNLKQVGAAMASYHSVHDLFPCSQLANRFGYSTNPLSEHCFVLPFLEQSALYNAINMNLVDVDSPDGPILENGTARRTTVATFLCPSDPGSPHRNSYRFNRGVFHARPGLPFDGPFTLLARPAAATVTDGLSRTAFASERVGGSFAIGSPDPRRDMRYPADGPIIRSDAEFIPRCLADPSPAWRVTAGRYWYYAGFLDAHYNHNGAPNDPRPSCYSGGVSNWAVGGLSPPRSYHPGGVQVLFGDGHVERVGDSIDPQTWRSIGTYNAGDF